MIIIKILGSSSKYKHLPSWNSKFVVTDGDNYTHAIFSNIRKSLFQN